MKRHLRGLPRITIIGALSFTVLSAACNTSVAADPTPVKTWKITPAATTAGGSTETPTLPPATVTPGAGAETPAPGTTLDLAAVGSVFDVTELAAPAGPITIKFDNRDAGIVHNVAAYPGNDASADPIASTELESGPIQQELQLDLTPGAYFYQCDAHPSTMSGTLTVSWSMEILVSHKAVYA